METYNRLQFRHHNEIFDTREEAIEYIYDKIKEEGEGLAKDQNSPYSYSLFAEPTILRYKNEEEETGCEYKKGPHIMLVIGSETNDTIYHDRNRFCIIDIDKTEDEIKNLEEELEKAIRSLTIIALNSDTLNLYADKTEDGTIVSGDVKTAETHVFEGVVKENNLMVVPTGDEGGPEGLFIYVDLTYDEASETFTFVVTNADGTLKKQAVRLPNNYLVSGEYKKEDESIHLHMKNGDEVVIDCEQLIDEWKVEGEASNTPIVLTREEYGPDEDHHHTEPWQDILRGDVRIADFINTNILEKTTDGRYLYVDGKATNIVYYYNGERSNVSEQLDKLNKIKISADNDNIIWNRTDGFFASAKLDYITNKNKLVFTTSTVSGGTITKEIQLNSVELFQNIYYDRNTEELVITYKDNEGNLKIVRIPISDMFQEWDVLNDAHSVKLVKSPHHVSGKDILTADVNISTIEDNILEERGEGNVHALFVKGTADNIKYKNTTVEGALDDLAAEDAAINEKLDQEIARSTAEDEKIETTIGSGFSTDAHETVTYKFDQLQEQVNSEAEKLQSEIDRSEAKDTEHDGRLDAIDAEIGDGFGPRATVRDAIDALSADTAASLKDVINNDNSIDVDRTDPVRPVIKVNLSGNEPYNTLRLEGDGLYNFIDLNYDPDTNKLTLTRSDNDSTENVSKELQLNSVSIIDGMEYDPTTETLIIKYHSGSEQKELRIPLGEIFQEWEVYNNPDSAVKLNRQRVIDGKDKLSGEVIISSAHTDNILENEHGALYVSGQQIEDNKNAIAQLTSDLADEIARALAAENLLTTNLNNEIIRAISAETALNNAITTVGTNLQNEIDRATAAEARIETKLDNEIARAQTKENELNTAIVNETLRAQEADNELYHDLADETAARAAADADLLSRINQESSRAQVAETTISEALQTEINNRQNGDTNLTNALTAETEARIAKDEELEQMIEDATLTFEDTSSIDFTKTTDNVVTAKVKIANSNGNIILNPEGTAYEGLFASVRLDYDQVTNKIQLYVNDILQDEKLLSAGALLDNISYDSVNRALVLTYTDANGVQHTLNFPVNELFNEWHVLNPSEKSALELTKTPAAEPGGEDTLGGRVLITDDLDNDGVPDKPGTDNIIEIRNNGLYVCGSAMTEALDIAECAKNELEAFEKAVIGHHIDEECGSGYTYEQNNMATYINSATSFNNADFILDQNIKRIDDTIIEIEEDVECVDSKAEALYKLLYTNAVPMPDCGEGVVYKPYQNACVISGATSFMEADQMLNDAICAILTMWVSGITCTNESEWVEDGANRKIEVHTRLSHGNGAGMSDEDLTIETFSGAYIDPTNTEFTDTNALRVVCLTEGGGGTIPDIRSKNNGIYLSSTWDCGLYYGPGDTEAKAQAEAAGYNTDYNTDEDASASNYNYMNNVRQNDI